MRQDFQEQLEVITQQIKELVGIYRRAINQTGMTENEFWIWYALIIMDGDYSQQDICEMWALPKQTINTIVARMVQKGYVVLEAIPGTRNRKNIRLTETGKEYGEKILLPICEAEERTFDRFPLEERAACTAALGKYIQILKEEFDGTETK